MWDVVVPITVGAIIGYVTNWLAIKMLFWPRGEVRVLGIRVPLTPGLFVRRRHDFSESIGALVENKFANADDLYALVQRAEDQGLVKEFLDNMGPVFRFAFQAYMRRVGPEDFKADCARITEGVRDAGVVSGTVSQKIVSMDVAEVEDLVMSVVSRELRGIAWAGAALGAGIGAMQAWL